VPVYLVRYRQQLRRREFASRRSSSFPRSFPRGVAESPSTGSRRRLRRRAWPATPAPPPQHSTSGPCQGGVTVNPAPLPPRTRLDPTIPIISATGDLHDERSRAPDTTRRSGEGGVRRPSPHGAPKGCQTGGPTCKPGKARRTTCDARDEPMPRGRSPPRASGVHQSGVRHLGDARGRRGFRGLVGRLRPQVTYVTLSRCDQLRSRPWRVCRRLVLERSRSEIGEGGSPRRRGRAASERRPRSRHTW